MYISTSQWIAIGAFILILVYFWFRETKMNNKLEQRGNFIRKFVSQKVVNKVLAERAIECDNVYQEVEKRKTQEKPVNLYSLEENLESLLNKIQTAKDKFESALNLAIHINKDMCIFLTCKVSDSYEDYLPKTLSESKPLIENGNNEKGVEFVEVPNSPWFS